MTGRSRDAQGSGSCRSATDPGRGAPHGAIAAPRIACTGRSRSAPGLGDPPTEGRQANAYGPTERHDHHPPECKRHHEPPGARAPASGDLAGVVLPRGVVATPRGSTGPRGAQPVADMVLGKNTVCASPARSTSTSDETHSQSRRLKSLLYLMLDAYRPFATKRCGKCTRVRIAANVDLQLRDGRAHFHGLMRCGKVWECPVCQLSIKSARAEEVRFAVSWHTERYGRESAAMLTSTVRHSFGDDIEVVRRGLADAWRYVKGGKGWVEMQRLIGLKGYIRGLETTHGRNGWHPHFHIVLLTERPISPWFLEWFAERWRKGVLLHLGAEAVPDREHGVDLRLLNEADYLQKLGLEISAPDKGPRNGNRTPLQILQSFVETGDVADLKLWQSYVAGMHGARMLTWSRGLRVACGVEERTDQEIVEGEIDAETHVVTIKGEAWDRLRDVPGLQVSLLEFAESAPPDVVREWLGQLTLWPPGYDPCEVDLSGYEYAAAADPGASIVAVGGAS